MRLLSSGGKGNSMAADEPGHPDELTKVLKNWLAQVRRETRQE
jgi:hypothetical protein